MHEKNYSSLNFFKASECRALDFDNTLLSFTFNPKRSLLTIMFFSDFFFIINEAELDFGLLKVSLILP